MTKNGLVAATVILLLILCICLLTSGCKKKEDITAQQAEENKEEVQQVVEQPPAPPPPPQPPEYKFKTGDYVTIKLTGEQGMVIENYQEKWDGQWRNLYAIRTVLPDSFTTTFSNHDSTYYYKKYTGGRYPVVLFNEVELMEYGK